MTNERLLRLTATYLPQVSCQAWQSSKRNPIGFTATNIAQINPRPNPAIIRALGGDRSLFAPILDVALTSLESATMKQAVCFLLAVICTLGCAHSAQLPTVTSPEPSSFLPSNHPLTDSQPNWVPLHVGQLGSKTQTVNDFKPPDAVVCESLPKALDNSLKNHIRKTVQPIDSPKVGVVSATITVNEHPAKPNKQVNLPVTPKKIDGEQASTIARGAYPNVSNEVWYGIGTLSGVMFTSIFAPLMVEWIKQRMGVGVQAAKR
jgi:hypothetical protein